MSLDFHPALVTLPGVGPSLFDQPLAELQRLTRGLALVPSAPEELTAKISETVAVEDPATFVELVLKAKPTPEAVKLGYNKPWTPEQGLVMESVRVNRKTAVPAGVGTGKTWMAARIALWFLYHKPNSIVVTTSTSWTQLQMELWAEISNAFVTSGTPLPGSKLLTQINLGPKWFMLAISPAVRVGEESATRFHGYHSDQVLVILDEATGIDKAIWSGADGIAIGPDDRILAQGNPTDPGSHFKTVCDMKSWNVIPLSCLDHPNVRHDNARLFPGSTSRVWVDDKLEEYGSEESPLYQSKVLGLWPTQSSDALISLAWITRAQTRWIRIREAMEGKGPPDAKPWKTNHRGTALGEDVAGEGEDLTDLWAIAEECAFMPMVKGKYAWHTGQEVGAAADLALGAARELGSVRVLALDDTGIGGGASAVWRRLEQKGEIPRFRLNLDPITPHRITLLPVNFGASAFDSVKFGDQKDEILWHLREGLRLDQLALPPDKELAKYGLPKTSSLIEQLTRCFYAPDGTGKIVVFDKRGRGGNGVSEKIRVRLSRMRADSPDLLHGLALAWWAYRTLRNDVTAPPPRTTEEQFQAELRRAMERKHRKKKAKKPGGFARKHWQG